MFKPPLAAAGLCLAALSRLALSRLAFAGFAVSGLTFSGATFAADNAPAASSPLSPAAVPPPPPSPPASPLASPPTSPSPTPATASSAFNPAISVVLSGRYAHLSQDPAAYRLQGFIPTGGEVGPGQRSFQLGESEITFSASIDPSFSGQLTAAFTAENTLEVEEALITHRGLFAGATLKAGRFLSAIGYLNSQHAHTWDFVDAPLAYQAMFGGQLKHDGLQVRWLAPSERYIALGMEVGSGHAFPGSQSESGRNGVGAAALFAHLGDDLGDSANWRVGLSWMQQRATERAFTDMDASGAETQNAFTGRSRTWALDGVFKWAPQGNGTQQNLKIQGEYFQRTEDGTLSVNSQTSTGNYSSAPSGWYLQTVYQFRPKWRVGARYDRLDSGPTHLTGINPADLPILQSASPTRGTLLLEHAVSEFSRLRLQLAADRSHPAGTDHQVFIQYTVSLGAHGGHAY